MKDVIERVQSVEKIVEETRAELTSRLDAQSKEIADKLAGTLETLNKAVERAQVEIQAEVEQVKGEVNEYVRTTQDQFSMENSFMIYQLAGTFVLIGSLISMWHMTAHLRKFNQPMVQVSNRLFDKICLRLLSTQSHSQRKILAILWMCPIYAITSWLSLVFVGMSDYLGVIKDLYEAYIIYMFLAFLIAVLGKGDRAVAVNTLALHADHLKPPMSVCGNRYFESARDKADAVLLQCQVFAMQFVLFKPLCSITRLFLEKEGVAQKLSHYDFRSPFFYVLIVENLSVFFAFMGLLKFYHAAEEDLAWCRPFPKFLCIKGVVFMTFWQGLAISILANTPSLTTNSSATITEITTRENEEDIWAAQAQNFLICLEMLIFSVSHFFAFPTAEWTDGYRRTENKSGKFGDNMALNDFLQDLKLVLSSKAYVRKKRKENIHKKTDCDGEDDIESIGSSDDPTAAVKVHKKLVSFLSSVEAPVENSSMEYAEEGAISPLHQPEEFQSIKNVDVDDDFLDIDDLRLAFAASLMSPELQKTTAALLRSCVITKMLEEGVVPRSESTRLDQGVNDRYGATMSLLNSEISNVQKNLDMKPPPFPPPSPPASETSESYVDRKEASHVLNDSAFHNDAYGPSSHERVLIDSTIAERCELDKTCDPSPSEHQNFPQTKLDSPQDEFSLRPSIFTKMSSLDLNH